MLRVVEHTKWWFTLSLIIIVLGIGSIFVRGVNTGIDFVGGTVIDISMGSKDYNVDDVKTVINKYAKEYETIKASNNNVFELNIKAKADVIKDEDVTSIVKDLQDKFGSDVKLISHDSIGPSIGNELKQKALLSLSIAIVAMLIYVGFRFELKYGAAAVLALVHDVLITLSVYFIFHLPINTSFIAAVLTIIGYSMNDTIVIFDRIRENLRGARRTAELKEVVDHSISQTIVRSIYTVSTTLITTAAIHVYVPAVRDFTLPLLVGIASGCYSSICIASPIWVILKNRSKKTAAV